MKSRHYEKIVVASFVVSFLVTLTYFQFTRSNPAAAASIQVSIISLEETNSDVPPEPKPNSKLSVSNTNTVSAASRQPSILIYHTHNRESWLPELDSSKKAEQAFDSEINVTLLGSYLKKKLSQDGIEVVHSRKDYPNLINDFDYANSYMYSKAVITNELNQHKELRYLFDIHRDASVREKTTVTFNRTDYAQVYFVVGTNHPEWKKNLKFAEKLQNLLNARVPNLSKGIYLKDKSTGNGEYNQSLSGNSALIEIGGVENTLEESYRTLDILAEAIRELWNRDAQPVLLAANMGEYS
ncbi:stage II sporulation protein P [Cohnella algarum]|uniref:stage II sporulation protein P n=1 Tax=Cohnella algarum TaxID=2044859 RepID=UPI001966F992|nr:stage II sporulation protein P [Cohnella algarum]MBN2981782.1 stage II sporulation protein P [Cohnella algarum]